MAKRSILERKCDNCRFLNIDSSVGLSECNYDMTEEELDKNYEENGINCEYFHMDKRTLTLEDLISLGGFRSVDERDCMFGLVDITNNEIVRKYEDWVANDLTKLSLLEIICEQNGLVVKE